MRMAAALIALGLTTAPALAQEDFSTWRLHVPKFESTGGGGVMIGEYNPVISGDKCSTEFTATLPDGKVYYNTRGVRRSARARRHPVHQRALEGA